MESNSKQPLSGPPNCGGQRQRFEHLETHEPLTLSIIVGTFYYFDVKS